MLRLSKPNIDNEETAAVNRVMHSGFLVHGAENEAFEEELAKYLGVEKALTVSSGTAALHLSLIALNIGPGDAVIVPDFTFPATVNVVELVGATPVFADVCPASYNINIETLSDAINNWHGPQKLKAIIPVHEFGCPANMSHIMEIAHDNNLKVIEDAACALGAQHNSQMVGTFGDIGCFSFHPRKSITTGEGGLIATNNLDLAETLKLYRNHGISKSPDGIEFKLAGLNYRLTNFQAAMGREQLKKFPSWLDDRQELKKVYDDLLSDVEGVKLPADIRDHSWQTYMIILDKYIDRNNVIKKLAASNIEVNLGAHSVLSQVAYQKYSHSYNNIVTSKILYKQGLALPFCESYNEFDLQQVSVELIRILKGMRTQSSHSWKK